MAEVIRQLKPLEDKVDRAHYAIERLFNTNGGPEGYLQSARREDKGTFNMIFEILNEHKADIQPIKDFIRDHQTLDKNRDSRIKRYIALGMLAIGLMELAMHFWK